MEFIPGQIFSYEELPKQVQCDFAIQFSAMEGNENCISDFKFIAELIPVDRLLENMDNLLGPNLTDELESDYVLSLMKDIQLNGLINPTIGNEGIHRSLAFINLEMALPHFIVVIPNEDD